MISLTYVASDNALGVWHLVAPMFKRIDQDDITAEQMLDAVIDERMQLWVGLDEGRIIYAGLTQIVTYASGIKSAQMSYLAGDRMDEWHDHHEQIEQWAKAVGCDRVEVIGRKGWARVLPDFRIKNVTFVKDIL